MYLDKQLMFSEEQAITASAISTNIIDLGAGDLGAATPMEVWLKVDEAFTATGAATLTVSLVSKSTVPTNNTGTVISSVAIGKADLTAGSEHFKIKVPAGCSRYLGLYYTVATGPMTAGKVTAGLTLSRQTNV